MLVSKTYTSRREHRVTLDTSRPPCKAPHGLARELRASFICVRYHSTSRLGGSVAAGAGEPSNVRCLPPGRPEREGVARRGARAPLAWPVMRWVSPSERFAKMIFPAEHVQQQLRA